MRIDREVQDPIVATVAEKLINRSEIGIMKYKADLTRDDLKIEDWLLEFQNELLDAANYSEVLRRKIQIVQRVLDGNKSNFEKVKEWCDKFEASKEPWLWMQLIVEEFRETMEAFGIPCQVIIDDTSVKSEMDKVKLLDGICDLIWVTYGLGASFHWDVDEAFEEVYDSNMSKLGKDGKPIKREDGKILKGPNFREPNLKKFVDAGDKSRFGDITGFKK